MSSLRLALKQSLQETGHLAPKEKKKKSSSQPNKRRPRQTGEPPRKRGRPRKNPIIQEEQPTQHADDDHDEHGSESENEFSYDSEEEESDEDDEDDEEGNEDDDEDGDGEEQQQEDESGHPEEDEEAAAQSEPQCDHEEGEEEEKVSDHDEVFRRKNQHKEKKRYESELTASDEERRRERKLLKKQLKHSAANMIQAQWKKKKGQSGTAVKPKESSETGEAVEEKGDSPTKESSNSIPPASEKKHKNKTSSSKSQTVEPPSPEVLEWSRSLSEKRCRRNIASGMRVKVRFAAKVKREGKVIKKKIWYGGRVSAVSKEGSKIRIKYDDGTSEISKFPDKDVVVDDTNNGKHLVPADKFIPPIQSEDFKEESNDHDSERREAKEQKGEEPRPEPKEQSVSIEQSASTLPPVPSLTNNEDPSKEPERIDKPKLGEVILTIQDKPDELVTNEEPTSEAVKSLESTPVAKVFEIEKKLMNTSKIPFNLGSPEEGELSPGLTFKREADSTIPEPTEVSKESQQNPTINEQATEVLEHQLSCVTEETMDPKPQDEEPLPVASENFNRSPETIIPKPSLTIRITNIKPEDKVPSPKKFPNSPQPVETDSEGEIHADTPITERQVKSIECKRPKDKGKRKRDNSDSIEESPASKKRIILKRDREPASKAPELYAADLSLPGPFPSPKEDDNKTKGDEVPPTGPKPSQVADAAMKETRIISISLKKSESGEDEDALAAPKMKRKKDRAYSPVPRGRKSPVPQRCRTPTRDDSPPPLGMVETKGPQVVNPEPLTGLPASDLVIDDGHAEGGVVNQFGSKNSAFSRKQLSKDAAETDKPEGDDMDISEEAKPSLFAGKVSEEPVQSARSGRRAAQQAKEKLNSKQDPGVPSDSGKKKDQVGLPESGKKKDPGAPPESGKKKKKRKRNEGEEEVEQSDSSVDDRQWVQCDSCGKWRILPSSVKVSSLPKHWYCRLNTYDLKRNNCSAPEQTTKQAAKEWRRARKRIKQQRLEQQQLDMESSQEEPKTELRRDLTPTNSPKPSKTVKKIALLSTGESKRTSPTATEDTSQPSDSGPDGLKGEKKGRKGKLQEAPDTPTGNSESVGEPKKPGRKRGRPARNQTPQKEKEDGDNVEWVQCEKCEKWRKLPPHISADELPDTWFCSMNTWNPEAASCGAPEDKQDATHHEVGNFPGLMQGAAGKFSYRSMIFGTGKKHNRPMSERTRAAESLFMRPVDDIENPHPTVMYSKSSAFLPRTSNFTKASTIEEEKAPGLFDLLSNSDLWAELRGAAQPMDVISSNGGNTYPKFVSFENLPDDIKRAMRQVVLHSLGSGTLTGDDVIREAQSYPWETLCRDFAAIRPYFNADIIINTLLALVRDGVVEMTCLRDLSIPISQWTPRYRKVRSPRLVEIEESKKTSRCMKISKPWKQREESRQRTDWITGGAAFA